MCVLKQCIQLIQSFDIIEDFPMLASIVSLMHLLLLVSTPVQCRFDGTTFSFVSILTQPPVFFAKSIQTKNAKKLFFFMNKTKPGTNLEATMQHPFSNTSI